MDFSASAEIWRFFSQHVLYTGIDEHKDFTFSIYPNPTDGLFTINISNNNNSKLSISVVDLLGKEVYTFLDNISTESYSKQIDFGNLATGTYFIKLNNGSDVKIKKLINQ